MRAAPHVKTRPIRPAQIEFGADEPPRATAFGDLYHPRAGALPQARHVFLGGNGLPARWAGRRHFTVLETGFGLGHGFLALWDAWRADPRRCDRLTHVAVELHPPSAADLARAHAGSPLPELAAALRAAWPPAVPGLHLIDFDGGRVRLLLGFGDACALLPEMQARADAFFLDGFAPDRNPAMWSTALFDQVARHAADDATAATWSVARAVRDGLVAAGFEVQAVPGIGGKREITVARFAPRHRPRPHRVDAVAPPSGEVAVIGAGLAGASVAAALAHRGLAACVFDRHSRAAAEASGNPAGLFHGTVHADDGPHARWFRAAALHAGRVVAALLAASPGRGSAGGLLRLADRGLNVGALQALIDRQGLPPGYVEAVDADRAARLAGVTLPGAAWWYPGGGWVEAPALVEQALATPGVRFVGDARVTGLEQDGTAWRLGDDSGRPLGRFEAVVIAAGSGMPSLLAAHGAAAWPLRQTRGQVSGWRGTPTSLLCPVTGGGYAVPLPGGGLLCGATEQPGDADPQVRDADHAHNFERLHALTGLAPPDDRSAWFGRVGWRLLADDRLPVAGALPDVGLAPNGRPPTQVRDVPRRPGLWVLGALGGRGITLAPLAAELLAARIAAVPWPVERDLAAAVDPARWAVRRARRDDARTTSHRSAAASARG